ncbi:squamosa promoter-binding-like protein 12 isoform X2 [Curcuma longa]|uniref:squamosa promoter-binding-like protein 12 isoform X2 n=1 Tax=Curcuma longa TaxID=136217 RepID=UPI003D9E224E
MWNLDAGISQAIASAAERKTPSICCKDFLDGLGSKTPFQWDWGSPVAFTGSLFDTERRKPELNIQPTERMLRFSEEIIYPRVVDSQTSPMAVETGHPKEPLTGLKLGRNFEDVEAANNIKNFPSASLMSNSATIKKSRLSQQNIQRPYCLVEGCNIDLTTAKDYHRKHKICESHSKSPKVIIAGQERRFCQQCSRLHDLSEFDQKKRSCRRRLYDHNARRRKPQAAIISFSSSRLSTLNYDDKCQTDLVFGQAPMGSSSWDGLTSFHFYQPEESRRKLTKAGGTDRRLQFSTTRTHVGSTACDDSNKLLSSKCTTAEVLNQDIGASVFSPSSKRPLDFRHAFSLLSNDSCRPVKPLQISGIKFIDANHTSIADPTTDMVDSTPGMLQDQQPLEQSTVLSFNSQISNYQFHLRKAPHGGSLSDTLKLHMLDHFIDFDSQVSFQR